jgi:NlpC/P60 family putative phage cell wall peptidase
MTRQRADPPPTAPLTIPIRRSLIVAIARSWRGTPYHHQASRRGVGSDCLGLVRGVWRDLYGREAETPPPYSPDWAEASGNETLLAAAARHMTRIDPALAREGDLLLFRYRAVTPAKHVGILTTPRRLIHATAGLPVSEFNLTPWWTRRISAAFAFPGVED